jgi:cell division protease FtsH
MQMNKQSASLNQREFSEDTAREIDWVVRDIVWSAFGRALALLKAKRDQLEEGAKLLLAKETLTEPDLRRLNLPAPVGVPA